MLVTEKEKINRNIDDCEQVIKKNYENISTPNFEINIHKTQLYDTSYFPFGKKAINASFEYIGPFVIAVFPIDSLKLIMTVFAGICFIPLFLQLHQK